MIDQDQTDAPSCLVQDSLRRNYSPFSFPRLWSFLFKGALLLPLLLRRSLYQILYRQAWEFASEQFFDATRQTNWEQWQDKFRGQISNERDLTDRIGDMLASLNDPYTRLHGRQEVKLRQASHFIPAVQSRLLESGIGYLKLKHFQATTTATTTGIADQVTEHLTKLWQAKALILDLRQNPGGSLMEAVEVASLFLKEGKIVSMKVRSGGSSASPHFINCSYSLTPTHLSMETTCNCQPSPQRISIASRKRYMANNRPVVVLADHDSASSAELVIGALKDNGAATILGTRSYGKGIGQDLLSLWNDAQLRLTTFQFYTPAGLWPGDGSGAANQGISPDITVEASTADPDNNNDKQLQAAINRLNRSSDHYIDAAVASLSRTLRGR